MKIFNKIISIAITFAITSTMMVGCTINQGNVSTYNVVKQTTEVNDGKLNIVCTIFPVYDWVNEIVGDNSNVDVTFLCDSGIDLHNFQPTIQDIITIQESDLFVYVGGDSDYWAKDVVEQDVNHLNLIEQLGDIAVVEEIVEGMQEHDHDHDYGTGVWASIRTFFSNIYHAIFPHDHSHDDILDEHVWLSLENAEILVGAISEELIRLSPENKSNYEMNTKEYQEQLIELDKEYKQMTTNANRDTILVADRFPLRYLVDDYNLEYFAAFSGCSADAEVSFETLKFLTDKAIELELDYILTMEDSDNKMAQTIGESYDFKDTLSFNSMQSVTKDAIIEGVSYINIMKSNLVVLTKALS